MYTCNRPDIVTEIKSGRIEWLGHVLNMEATGYHKRILYGRFKGKRRIDRPRLIWLDYVVNDLRKVGVRQWRKKLKRDDNGYEGGRYMLKLKGPHRQRRI
jgi:hypothetical protein